jgi:hypothetical protein
VGGMGSCVEILRHYLRVAVDGSEGWGVLSGVVVGWRGCDVRRGISHYHGFIATEGG